MRETSNLWEPKQTIINKIIKHRAAGLATVSKRNTDISLNCLNINHMIAPQNVSGQDSEPPSCFEIDEYKISYLTYICILSRNISCLIHTKKIDGNSKNGYC